MSTVKTNNVQIGQSATATNNFTWYQPASPDGTVRLGNGNSGAVTDRVTVTSAGSVGIGTSSPAFKLDLSSAYAAHAGTFVTGDDTAGWGRITNDNGALYIQAGSLSNGSAVAQPIIFSNMYGGVERMRIDSAGKVGIGTGNDAIGSILEVRGSVTTTFAPNVYNTTLTGTSAATTGLAGSGISFRGYTTGSTTISDLAFISGVKENSTDGNYAGTLIFGTRTNGSGGGNFERMRITSAGDVGIGTSSPSYQLQLSLNSAAKPTSNVWTVASDERVKTVTGEYTKGLDAVCSLRPVTYKYNGKAGFVADGAENISIIAQEAREAFPECIGTFSAKLNETDEEETELLNWDGHALTFALVNAIKELRAQNEDLRARLAAVEGAIA